MFLSIPERWRQFTFLDTPPDYAESLFNFVVSEYKKTTIYPLKKDIFTALDLCFPQDIQVVILGQDPYHGDGQANGLAFSVQPAMPIPPSLKNIYKEMQSDIQKPISSDGDLRYLAKQGVLLINATMTVQAKKPGSHQKCGWENFTDDIIQSISNNKQHVVFLLWGNFAKSKLHLIDASKHLILTAAHPSPFSAYNGFFGCRHFSKTNDYLQKTGQDMINW